jgi:arylformamidase
MMVYPGDPSVRIIATEDVEKGDEITLTEISMGVHSGTHIDSPRHYIKGGPTIDSLPFGAVNGRARVIAIENETLITAAELERNHIEEGEILLFKTRNSALWTRGAFHSDYVHLSTDGAAFLARKKPRSVGIDYVSVGGFEKNEAGVHRLLLELPVWIIESLDLTPVEPGYCDFRCLPLRIEGAEAAPARAFVKVIR